MRRIFKKTLWFWVCVVVGLVAILPYIFVYTHTDTLGHEKLHYFYQDSELVYLARIREIIEGHTRVASPTFLEYKEAKNIQLPFSEWVYAIPTFGNPDVLPEVAMLLKFILPTMLAICIFMFTYRVLEEYIERGVQVHISIALFVATFCILGLEFNHVGYWDQVFMSGEKILHLSLWTRLVNPITGAIGLFLLAYLLFRIDTRPMPGAVIGSGLLLGFMSGYIFSFSYALVMIGGMLVFALLEKRWVYVKALTSILVIGAIINAPYIGSILFGDTSLEELKKSGLLLTHAVLHNKILYAALTVCFFYTIVLKYTGVSLRSIFTNRFLQWCVVMIFGGLVLLNQQIITGRTVWPGHYVQYTNPVVYLIVIVFIYGAIYFLFKKYRSDLLQRYTHTVRVLSSIGIVFVLSVNIYTAIPALGDQPLYTDSQRYALPLEFLRANAPEHCVVFVFEAIERLEKYVPAYTQCDLYHNAYVFYAVPPERVLHNYIVYLRMVGVPKDQVEEYLDVHEADIHRFFFEDWVDIFPNNGDTWLLSTKSKEAQEAFLVKYKTLIADAYRKNFDIPFDILIKKYHIDYILYDLNHELPSEVVEEYPETFRDGNLVIRRVE